MYLFLLYIVSCGGLEWLRQIPQKQSPRIYPRAGSDKSRAVSRHLCGSFGDGLRSRAPDVCGENRAGFLAVSAGDDDSDRLFRVGDFTNLLHSSLTVFELADVTSATRKGTLDARCAQMSKSLIFHYLCYTRVLAKGLRCCKTTRGNETVCVKTTRWGEAVGGGGQATAFLATKLRDVAPSSRTEIVQPL